MRRNTITGLRIEVGRDRALPGAIPSSLFTAPNRSQTWRSRRTIRMGDKLDSIVKGHHDVIVVADSHLSVESHTALSRGGPFTTWYFGNDYARYLELSARRGQSPPVSSAGEAINREAGTLSRALIDIDAQLASGRFPVSWCSSDIAELNPYVSTFYLDICRSVALVKAAQGGKRFLVIVDDPAFGRALTRICRDNGIVAAWHGPHGLLNPWLQSIRAHAGFLRGWLRQRRALRRHPGGLKALAGCKLWMMSWTDGQAGGAGIDVKDRFLGDLPGWLRSAGYKIGWLKNPIAWLHPIGEIAKSVDRNASSEPAVLAGRLFGIRELLRAYGHLLMLPFALRRQLVLDGIDLTQLVHLALRRELASARLVAAALYASLAISLNRAGLAPAALFYSFENQPWEKAMLLGFRRALPHTRLIGVQNAPFAERFFSYQVSSRQWQEGAAPDVLVTIGPEFRERTIDLGTPSDRVLVGGAVRFANLLTPRAERCDRVKTGFHQVLVTCPDNTTDAFELAHKAAAATEGMAGLRLLINFHPLVDAVFRKTLRDRLSQFVDCSHVDFVDGRAMQLLEQADILLYNSSSTAFEAAAMRVPAIFVESDIRLDLDVLPGAGTIRVRNPADLRRQIESLLSDVSARKTVVDTAWDQLSECFARPKPEFWIALAERMSGTAA